MRLSGAAKQDLAEIGAYTQRNWGAEQKRKYLGQIRTAFEAIIETPGLGAPRDDVAAELRSFQVQRHVIFYRVAGDLLIVSRILHDSMDPGRHPFEDPQE